MGEENVFLKFIYLAMFLGVEHFSQMYLCSNSAQSPPFTPPMRQLSRKQCCDDLWHNGKFDIRGFR